jgi:hypothetical protein
MDWAFGGVGKFRRGFLENFFAAAADVDGGSQLEETVGHGLAEAGAAASYQDAFIAEEVVAEHLLVALDSEEMPANSRFLTGLSPGSE